MRTQHKLKILGRRPRTMTVETHRFNFVLNTGGVKVSV